MKVRKEEAFMITITINFSSSKVRCGPSMMYQLEIAADFQQRDKFSGISSSSYFQVRPGKPLLCSFFARKLLKQVLLGSWWVSGADPKYNECILMKFDI